MGKIRTGVTPKELTSEGHARILWGDGNVSCLDRDLHLFHIFKSNTMYAFVKAHGTVQLRFVNLLCVNFASKNKQSENKY